MAKNLAKLRGTEKANDLTGSPRKNVILGLGGDDVISTQEGNYRVWGGSGNDTFRTLDNGKGYMKIMDFSAGDKITFCGCRSTRIEQRGEDAWIVKDTDVKAVVKGVNSLDLEIDFGESRIQMKSSVLLKLRGTNSVDILTGTRRNKFIFGLGGDDLISTEEGKYRVWGGAGNDTFKTLNGGDGYMTIMDFEVGDTIGFCGCGGTRLEQRGKNAWIVKGDDVKAVVKGVDVNDLEINFASAVITMNADPLA